MSDNAAEYGRPLVRDEEILKTARKTIASRLPREVRDQFIRGKHDHFQVVQAICDAIEAERERCGWQPIVTVPKDGTIIDLWHVKGFRVVDEWWDAEDGWTGGWLEDSFTHWMKSPIANP